MQHLTLPIKELTDFSKKYYNALYIYIYIYMCVCVYNVYYVYILNMLTD